ncbi:putative potassium channel protein [Tupanvirus soda lake]|uniref:Potassium channel protein n=2 Tax=Tupanvirus TaxID=2094720 RepID=A0AC62ADV4_9VIRU|nr:putative potassium channel protein [Tupanvirus soda lake]QKU35868.1 putative potassium channel protein [Tupanvirus soda lake]
MGFLFKTDTKQKKALMAIIIIFIILVVILLFGIIGYKYFFGMSWTDAIFNTSITASTLGIAPHERTNAEKIFTSIYAIVSGIFFVTTISTIIAYIFSLYFSND